MTYPRERTWSDCEAELERLREGLRARDLNLQSKAAEIERLRGYNDTQRKLIEELHLELGSLMAVTVGNRNDDEIKIDYGMLGFSVISRIKTLLRRHPT